MLITVLLISILQSAQRLTSSQVADEVENDALLEMLQCGDAPSNCYLPNGTAKRVSSGFPRILKVDRPPMIYRTPSALIRTFFYFSVIMSSHKSANTHCMPILNNESGALSSYRRYLTLMFWAALPYCVQEPEMLLPAVWSIRLGTDFARFVQ